MKKRILSTLLTLCMALGLMSTTVMAAGGTGGYHGNGYEFTVTNVFEENFETWTLKSGKEIPIVMLTLDKDAVAKVIGEYAEETTLCAYDNYGNMLSMYALGAEGKILPPTEGFIERLDASNGLIFSIQAPHLELFYKFADISVGEVPVEEKPVETAKPVISVDPNAPKQAVATPTASKIFVNGKEVAFDAYNINGNNYFKLRDIAYIIQNTEKQFDVQWDPDLVYLNNSGEKIVGGIALVSNKAYTVAGGEMAMGDGVNKDAVLTKSPITKDGAPVQFTAYNINGNNYFKLRDLGMAFNFNVAWNATLNAIVINTAEEYID